MDFARQALYEAANRTDYGTGVPCRGRRDIGAREPPRRDARAAQFILTPGTDMRTMGKFIAVLAIALFAAALAHAQGFKLSSPQVKAKAKIADEQVFNGFGCTGGNVSPEIKWTGAPDKAKSFALTVYDPDAPTGSGFWHWVVFNIPAGTTSLAKGAGDPKANTMPAGTVQSRTDFGVPGWGGPCPPQGDKPHRYIFTLFAVDVDKLDAGPDTSAAVVGFNLHFHTVAKATLTGMFGR
jgi:Raf kinase inhibitor-like YbhB/YbcL family protein